jgi:hypothetical protein
MLGADITLRILSQMLLSSHMQRVGNNVEKRIPGPGRIPYGHHLMHFGVVSSKLSRIYGDSGEMWGSGRSKLGGFGPREDIGAGESVYFENPDKIGDKPPRELSRELGMTI